MTSATPCIAENEILEFLAGTLPPDRTKACQEHMELCAVCSFVAADAAGEAVLSGRPPQRADVCTFCTDELVGGRYRIVTFLAHGGMGEVYEAEDNELGQRIALKTIAASISDDPMAAARLKREVQLARLVTHPNVCRIFDLGRHQKLPETTFLTMELLRGETLGHRIRRLGRLDVGEAEAVAFQVAAGLDAAHAAGVVHRDLKSDNIMLLERGSGLSPRAVVMDFGLARPTETGANLSGSLLSASAVGTVGYMAPEQVEGGLATTASDIYAFGVVLFEMFTGQLPFVGTSPLSTAAKRLTEDPRSPQSLNPAMGLRWESTILRCLERDPAARFVSSGDAVRFASPSRLGAAPTRSGPYPARVKVALIATAAAVLATAVSVYVSQRHNHPSMAPPPAPPIQANLAGQPPRPSEVAAAIPLDTPAPAQLPSAPIGSTVRPPSARPSQRLVRHQPLNAVIPSGKSQPSPVSPVPAAPAAHEGGPTATPQGEDSLIDPFADQ